MRNHGVRLESQQGRCDTNAATDRENISPVPAIRREKWLDSSHRLGEQVLYTTLVHFEAERRVNSILTRFAPKAINNAP